MAKSLKTKPEKYLHASVIRTGVIYLTQEHRVYLVDSIWNSGISYRSVRRDGSISKYTHRGIYGVSVFFVEELEMASLELPLPTPQEGPWSQSGRLFYKMGKEMFTIRRNEFMSPTDADLFCKRLVKLLNIMELE